MKNIFESSKLKSRLHNRSLYKWWVGILFILPALFAFTFIVVVPSVRGIYNSFTTWNPGNVENPVWTGADNYIQAFKEQKFVNSIYYTIVYSIVVIMLVNVFGFFLAWLVTLPLKGTNLFKMAYFIPNLLSALVLGYLWQILFSSILPKLFNTPNTNIFDSRWSGLFGLAIASSWKMSGYVMLIYAVAILGVPKELKEAAKIDGVGFFKRFRAVTLPSVMPAVTVALFLTLANSFKEFELNYVLGAGLNQVELISFNIYQTAFVYADPVTSMPNWGLAQAKAVIFLILVIFFGLLQVSLTKKSELRL